MTAEGGATRRRATVVLVLVWAVSLILWFQPGLVLPDGAGYYVYLPSTWLDHDLVFFDEWQMLGMVRSGIIHHKEVTETGHLGNHWTAGAALTWYPAFIAADALRGFLPGGFPRNGFSLPYLVAVVLTSALAGLGTLLAGFAAARKTCHPGRSEGPGRAGGAMNVPPGRPRSLATLGMTGGAALLAAIGAWLGTPLFFYSLVHATMSHAVSALACALVVAAALAVREREDVAFVLLAGLAAGYACAARPQNAPIVLVPLILAPLVRRHLLVYAGGGVAAAAPQLVISSFLYGNPIGFLTGGSAKPFAWLERIWVWEPLFSWYHGLFTWTPFAILGITGLVLLLRRDRPLAVAGLMMIASQWAVNATLERSFWGGVAFGQRRFDNCIIFFIIGAAVLFAAMRPAIATLLAAVTSLWTLSIFAAVRNGLDLAAYQTPGELLDAQLAALAALPRLFVPLGMIIAERRGIVAVHLIAIAIAAVALIAVARLALRTPRAAAGAAVAYAVVMSLYLSWCGTRDAARIDEARSLVELNRVYGALPGGADVRFGLLQDEIAYLKKSGREDEAARTQRELDQLRATRADALRRLQEGR